MTDPQQQFYFVVARVGLSGAVDEDDVAIFRRVEAAREFADRESPPCGCDSMCPCPYLSIQPLTEHEMSDAQRSLRRLLEEREEFKVKQLSPKE